MKTVAGTFKSGTVHFGEPVAGLPEGPVLITFLESAVGDREAPPMTPELAAELRSKLATWEADWNAPGMEAYDKP